MHFLPGGLDRTPTRGWVFTEAFRMLRALPRPKARPEIDGVLYEFGQALGAVGDQGGYLAVETVRVALFGDGAGRHHVALAFSFLRTGDLPAVKVALESYLGGGTRHSFGELQGILSAYGAYRKRGGDAVDFSPIRRLLRAAAIDVGMVRASGRSTPFASDEELLMLEGAISTQFRLLAEFREALGACASVSELEAIASSWLARELSPYLQRNVERGLNARRSSLGAPR